jgi:cation/acetate symporter
LAAGAIAAALIVASALIRSLLAVGMIDQQEKFARPWSKRALAVALGTGALAAAIAALRPDDLAGIVVSALSLGAAGLFPALTVGLAWKRATAAGVMAAIVLGAGVTLYYDVGIQAFPVSFYETWAPLSNAGEFAIENFRALETDAADAGNEQARQAALASLEALARGTPGRPGLANWAGIDSASGAIFGVPAGVLALILVSLLTGRRKRPHP